ncbi:unnamed protein product [Zymoseptoria tritici ST99CH_1E4]|uniref:SET domain-containing protein n=1 Tax=Zymoseptoria tritici ST99CH_1E4 TaxID=1276532 RepID=A0A2H1FJN0_ZYMTR|nr:unnamed protein product [Zymoseptoria tritici ST99CH_1E4]
MQQNRPQPEPRKLRDAQQYILRLQDAMKKYWIDTSNGSNFTMRALESIKPGELILSERPLAELEAGLASTHDDTRFFNSPAPFNAVGDINFVVARMRPEDRAAFRALRNGDNTAHTFQTNSFEDEVTYDSGLKYIYFRVYKDISRIDHSCVPNAIIEHLFESKLGEIRALRKVEAGEEILINYAAPAKSSFQKSLARNVQFESRWNFKCNCIACASNNQDSARVRLLYLYDTAKAAFFRHNEKPTQFHLRMVNILDEYTRACMSLNITDTKLAEGYERLANHHESLAVLASKHYMTNPRRQHCAVCATDMHQKPHLNAALAAAIASAEIMTKCCGRDNAAVQTANDRILELVQHAATS